VSTAPALEALGARLAELLQQRVTANQRFFAEHEERLARLCHQMAERFAAGGRLVAFGGTPSARSDARHVAVEFVHPVIVGKRALPAIGLTGEGGALEAQVELLARPSDIAMGFGADEDGGEAAAALALARARGCLTVAFSPAGAEWEFEPPGADRYVRQELVETLYHLLWELVHVFFEQRGLLAGREARPTHDAGAAAFLYPFLDEREDALEPMIGSVRHSVRVKAREIDELRTATLTGSAGEALTGAAAATLAALRGGGKVLALGNGGSATDAMDFVADLRARLPDAPSDPDGSAPSEAGRAWPAIDLTEDAAILTAVANDIGTEAMFARQVIAYGRAGDVLVAFSTSGNSENLLAALREARRRELVTVAFVGYDGGTVLAEGLADHVVISPSEHIPRIQEAQASGYHALRELLACHALDRDVPIGGAAE
jgi:D-sedoheptulose 7-phosphate isomerase